MIEIFIKILDSTDPMVIQFQQVSLYEPEPGTAQVKMFHFILKALITKCTP
jgi:hypothetical protein